ncbi:MAG: hypothetical protein ACREPM_22425 [Gemmatimonadaceae bacterium]
MAPSESPAHDELFVQLHSALAGEYSLERGAPPLAPRTSFP